MVNVALPVLARCDTGCGRVAVRGNYCVEHATACADCGHFYAASDLRAGQCADCETAACEYELEEFVSAVCTCASQKPSHVARKVLGRVA